MQTSRRNTVMAAIGAVFATFGSAASVAAAEQAGRVPDSRHLKQLGIDVEAYRAIGRR